MERRRKVTQRVSERIGRCKGLIKKLEMETEKVIKYSFRIDINSGTCKRNTS
jgi:hypothetical protein